MPLYNYACRDCQAEAWRSSSQGLALNGTREVNEGVVPEPRAA